MARLQTEYDSLDYARLRKKEYPPTKEFMEAFWRTDGGQKQEIHSSISSAV